jgi:L-amino acid N-acyltransferase YncA
MGEFKLRLIAPDDAVATLKIYKHYVDQTIVSFEYEAPSVTEWAARIKTNSTEYPWVVCEFENEIIGYAYASKHRYRTAYSWSAESTVYLSEKFHGRGLARILYETLFGLLKIQGYVNVFAGVALPNEKSENLHLALGFSEIGIFKKIGFKLNGWHDTRWFQLQLTEPPERPSMPNKLAEVAADPAFLQIIESANVRLQHNNYNRQNA